MSQVSRPRSPEEQHLMEKIYVSLAHSDDDVARTLEVFAEALDRASV